MTENHNPRYTFVVGLLTALVGIGPVSTDLYLPSLPSVATTFGASVAAAQLTLSVFIAGFAVATLVYGPLSDRFGRRPVLLGGLALFTLASFGCLTAHSIATLIVWRFAEAVGGCAGPVVARAVVRDLFKREDAARVLAYMSAAMSIAPALAPIAGGWIHVHFGWRGHFVVLGTMGLALLAAMARLLAETNRMRDPTAVSPARLFANTTTLLRDRTFTSYAACFGLSYSCLFGFISGGAFTLIGALHVAPQNFGSLFVFVAGAYIAGALAGGQLTRRLGILRMIGAGVVIGSLGALAGLGLALAGVMTPAAIIAPAAVVFLSCGLVFPNAVAGAIGPFPQMAGLAASIATSIQMAAGALAGALVGAIFDGTARPMFGVIAAAALGALVVFFTRLLPSERAAQLVKT